MCVGGGGGHTWTDIHACIIFIDEWLTGTQKVGFYNPVKSNVFIHFQICLYSIGSNYIKELLSSLLNKVSMPRFVFSVNNEVLI